MMKAFKMTFSELCSVKLILETATRQWLLPLAMNLLTVAIE